MIENNNSFASLSRAQLARLGREYMAAAQFNSRCGYAAVRINHGEDAYKTVAIDNWLAASPVYTRRMQQAMGFAGRDDVASIFKGLQLECGFAHQYFDVHFEVESADKGRFWLARCGPLLETEPRGDDAVKVMCHDVEDPTFDATAVATNPRARMRPVHRPPRKPEERQAGNGKPHCEWSVFVDDNAEPLPEPAGCKIMATSKLAQLKIDRPAENAEPGGLADYSGELFEQLQLEQLSHAALVVVCKELALQNQLLVKALGMVVEQQYGREAAQAVAEFQMTGSTWAVAERLSRWAKQEVSITQYDPVGDILRVLSVHPLFQPVEYQNVRFSQIDEHNATVELLDSPALSDSAQPGWINWLADGFTEGLDALVQGVNRRARCRRPDTGENSWLIEVGSEAREEDEPLAVQVAKSTVLYSTEFKDRIPALQIS